MSQRISSSPIPELAARLPAFPKVVPKLLDCPRKDAPSLDSLVMIARHDPVISATILATANRLRRMRALPDLSDLFAAASIIGFNNIRQIIISVRLNGFISQGSSYSYFVEHSLAVAIVAQELAIMVRISPVEAYVAGILHDVGQLLFFVQDANLYHDIRREAIQSGNLLQLEADAFGLDHCQMGILLGNYWKLPNTIMQAIGGHHKSDMVWMNGLQAVINLAETLCKALDLPHSPHNRVTTVSNSALEFLQLRWNSLEMADCFGRCRARFGYARDF
ncbi:MAG: HDOD domain-containing protein [Deltaproteobacteria bacterium]|nr:HDOD domain-containing protein [Deltaproteobacteria bacterium]